VPDVHYQKSRGLLGMALPPDLEAHPYVYLHYTYLKSESVFDMEIESRLVRYELQGDTLLNRQILLDSIPGQTYHNGSRILITPQNELFLSTGDAGQQNAAFDSTTLVGKILRLNLDGSIPDDNPIPGSPVWSWGHRNAQGLTWVDGQLYASEHGPATDDEVNRILPGRNYGWPKVHGYCDRENEKEFCETYHVVEPLKAWSPTIAVAGLSYYDSPAVPEWRHSLLVVNLKGQALRVLPLSEDGAAVEGEHIYFQKHFGRLRDLCVAPNGDIYLSTSNRDWHPRFQPFLYDTAILGNPVDDRIIRLQPATGADRTILEQLENPVALQENPEAAEMQTENWNLAVTEEDLQAGARLYEQQCALCHRPDGHGVEGLYPPLAGTSWVTGSKPRLINVVLRGMTEPTVVNGATYEEPMPPFATLSDEEIAAILSFIRQSWENDAGAVLAGEVLEERRLLTEE
jgi:glucose/arabinose dehydrogenase/cytochrome c5